MHLLDKMLKHFFSNLEISYNPVFQGADSRNVTWRSTQHTLRIDPNCGDALLIVVVIAYRNNRWFIQNNTLITHVDQCVRRPKINRKIAGEQAPQFFKHECKAPRKKWSNVIPEIRLVRTSRFLTN